MRGPKWTCDESQLVVPGNQTVGVGAIEVDDDLLPEKASWLTAPTYPQ